MPLFVFSIFLSAFLLFQVQPMIARYILPWYGGSPAVWTTCMLFFQIGLLGGYAYAHLLASKFRDNRKLQLIIHLIMVVVAILFFCPITPDDELKPTGSAVSSVWGIVLLLAKTVGLPYLVMAASGPLLQHWFAGAHPGRSPYRLYAVSNIGSLLGLLSYPFLFEPNLGLKHQTWGWSGSFFIYGALAILCAWAYCRSSEAKQKDNDEVENDQGPPSLLRKILWVVFSALGSAAMLAITNQMSQDISVTPYLWVLPLALYILTFVISFDRSLWYQRLFWVPLMVLSIYLLGSLLNSKLSFHPYMFLGGALISGVVAVALMLWKKQRTLLSVSITLIVITLVAAFLFNNELIKQFKPEEIHIYWQLAIFMLTIFAVCMVCHGEMVSIKPASRYLTGFYLLMSLGGALGGALISLIAPNLFNGYWELHIILIIVPLLVGLVISFRFLNSIEWRVAGVVLSLLITFFISLPFYRDYRDTQKFVLESRRSFHGIVHVYEEDKGTEWHSRSMYHGQICHGVQYLDEAYRNKPNSYYTMESGVGAVMQCIQQRIAETREPLKIGVIGLGSGTLATHAKAGDDIVFYEINDQVLDLAKKYFTYLDECEGNQSVIIGDARTSMEQQLNSGDNQQYDLLFIDAFSGDSIPIHLVTQEAFDIYFKHLKPGGAIVAHITNLHIDLSDPIRQLAAKFNKQALQVENDPPDDYYSQWVVITDNQDLVETLDDNFWLTPWEDDKADEIHWTDDYSNLLDVIIPNSEHEDDDEDE